MYHVLRSNTAATLYPDSTMAPNENFIQRAVNNGVAIAGGYAGGVVDVVGKSVSGAGRNVGNRLLSPLSLSPFHSTENLEG